MKWWIVGLFAAQALDISTSIVNVRNGCREVFFPNVQTAAAVKAGAVGITITLGRNDKHKALVVGISAAGIVSGSFAAAHNLAQHCR